MKDTILSRYDKKVTLIATGIVNPASSGDEELKSEMHIVDTSDNDVYYQDLPSWGDKTLTYVYKIGSKGTLQLGGIMNKMPYGLIGLHSEGSLILLPDQDHNTFRLMGYTGQWVESSTRFVFDALNGDSFVNSVRKHDYPCQKGIVVDGGTAPVPEIRNFNVITKALNLNNTSFVWIDEWWQGQYLVPLFNHFVNLGLIINDTSNAIGKNCTIFDAIDQQDDPPYHENKYRFRIKVEFNSSSDVKLVLISDRLDLGTSHRMEVPLTVGTEQNIVINSRAVGMDKYEVEVLINGVLAGSDDFPYDQINTGGSYYSYIRGDIEDGCDVSLGYYQVSNYGITDYEKTWKHQLYFG